MVTSRTQATPSIQLSLEEKNSRHSDDKYLDQICRSWIRYSQLQAVLSTSTRRTLMFKNSPDQGHLFPTLEASYTYYASDQRAINVR